MSSSSRLTLAPKVALLIVFLGIAVTGVYALVTNDTAAERLTRALIFVGAAVLGVIEIHRGTGNADRARYSLVGGGMLFVGSGYGVVLELLGTGGFSNPVVATLVFLGIGLTWLGPSADDTDGRNGDQ